MTPLDPQVTPKLGGPGFLAGLAVGLAVSLLFMCLGSAAGYAYVQKQKTEVRRGWNLVPVVVAAVDMDQGTVITMEMISQRSIPEQFITPSIVKPDSASFIINQKVLVPIMAGDPILWSHLPRKGAQ